MLLKCCTQVNLYKARDVAYEFCEKLESAPSLAWHPHRHSRESGARMRRDGQGVGSRTQSCKSSNPVNPDSDKIGSEPTWQAVPPHPSRHSRENGNPGMGQGVGNAPNPENPLIPKILTQTKKSGPPHQPPSPLSPVTPAKAGPECAEMGRAWGARPILRIP